MIDESIYNKVNGLSNAGYEHREVTDEFPLKHLNTELAEIGRGLEEVSKNLSNMVKFVDEAVAMSCKLGALWNDGNFENRQGLQKLMFPTGILYDKENDGYRTDNENEVFKIFCRLSVSYEDKKEKATSENIRLSPSVVGVPRLERGTSWSQTRCANQLCYTPLKQRRKSSTICVNAQGFG